MSCRLDKKFLKKLHKRLVETEKRFFASSSELERVPSLEQLEEIVSIMLWASTKLEEGRPLRFGVTYAQPFPIEHLALIFDFPPKLWSVEEIRRLAPAVPPLSGQIGIWPSKYVGLTIWGLLTTSLTGITFEVVDPGRIIVSVPIDFRIAEISLEKSGFINPDWSKAILNLMTVREVNEGHPAIDEILSLLYRNVTQEILSQIRLLRHGGTIIFVPEDDKWKRSIEKPVTYDCMRPFNGVRHIEDALRTELQGVANEETTKNEGKAILNKGIELLASPQYKAFITSATRSAAYLAAVDGATVLSRKFDVLAFGAKINVAQKGRKAETVTKILPLDGDENSESSLNYEFRGKRHLSAARFVINNPGSVAFVVSQDGGVTALAISSEVENTTENKLLAYKGLELLV